MIDISLKSELNPIPGFETSFAIIQSQCFLDNFFLAFSITLSVYAAKPMTNFGLK